MEQTMKKWFSWFVLFALSFTIGLQAKSKYHFEETVYVPLPQSLMHKWKLGIQKADEEKGASVTRYILESETMENWSQLLNIQFKDKELVKAKSAESAMEIEVSKSQHVNYKVLSHNPHDVLYEREFPTGEHEIVRMILTKKGLHRVAYVKRGPLTQEERSQWIGRLSKGMLGGKEG
jgi:hypothetical protein